MSWEAYVESLKQRGMVHGAICGINGDWFVPSEGSNITLDELKVILNNYGSDVMRANGIRVGGQKYMFLSSQDFSPFPLRGKWKDQGGVHIVKSNTTMMVGVYDNSKKAEEAAVAVESVVESLIKADY